MLPPRNLHGSLTKRSHHFAIVAFRADASEVSRFSRLSLSENPNLQRIPMKRIILPLALLLGAGVALADGGEQTRVEHVLIISVDGMHQQDLSKCLAANTCPNIAKLADHG